MVEIDFDRLEKVCNQIKNCKAPVVVDNGGDTNPNTNININITNNLALLQAINDLYDLLGDWTSVNRGIYIYENFQLLLLFFSFPFLFTIVHDKQSNNGSFIFNR